MTKRWLLGAGAACAGVGLALKLGDVVGPAVSRPSPPDARAPAAASLSSAEPAAVSPRPEPAPARPQPPTPVPERPQGAVAPGSSPTPSADGGPSVARSGSRDPRVGARRPRPPVRARGAREGGSLDVARTGPGVVPEPKQPASRPSTAQGGAASPREEPVPPEPATPTANGAESPEMEHPLDARVEVPEVGTVSGSRGTVSLWLQPQWEPGNQDDATLAQLGETLQIVKNVNFVRFELLHAEGMLGVGAPVNAWQAGEWHLLTATWNGNELALYLDGQLVNRTVQPIPIDLPADTMLSLGSEFPESRPVAPGVIGRVGLWGRTLGAEEVAAAYETATNGQ